MPREKHITIDLTNLSVLRIVCATCQAAETVPVIPKYQPPARCPNHGCTATWFVPKTPAARALQLPKQGHRIFWLCVVADLQKFCRVFLAGSICLAVPFALRLRSTEGLGTSKDFRTVPSPS
jgi:hypothetical protein